MSLTETPICNFGEKAITFNLLSTENKMITLDNTKGKNGTLIMFICNHCPYVKAVIKDIVNDTNVLKKEGMLIIFVPAYFSPLFFIYRFFKFFKLIDKYWPYTNQDFLHKSELKKMMVDAGCQNVTVKRMWSSFFFSMVGFCKK